MKKIKFSLSQDVSLDLHLIEGIFEPTGTTKLLIDSVTSSCKSESGQKILDLGAGCGVVGISLCKQGFMGSTMFASDLNNNSLQCMSLNAKEHQCEIIIREGSIFEPWEGEKFDIIVDDISGVSDKVAKISDWFDSVPCNSGIGGDILTNKVLSQSKDYLNDGGVIFFPVISFSNVNSILSVASQYYENVDCVSRMEWILPQSMQDNLDILKKLKKSGHIDYEDKFGTIVWYTEIYKAYN